ncbi:MAG: hypothetical protein QOD94_2078 [Alphaproteobacteria bacterium]|jgi:uncharacterized protein (DUF433 family)|nr:hypothetical protein [Alphaproteobacteria bacterium]
MILPQRRYIANDTMSTPLDRITPDPDVMGGRPCIRSLRVRVVDILDMLGAGASRAEILADYPYLEGDDIGAALEFAAHPRRHWRKLLLLLRKRTLSKATLCRRRLAAPFRITNKGLNLGQLSR